MKRAIKTFIAVFCVSCLILTQLPRPVAAQDPVLTLYFPILASQPNLIMGVAVVNNDPDREANLEFTAYGDDGSLFRGEGIENPARKTVAARSQIADVITETFGSGLTNASGWIQMTSDNPNARGFFLLFDPALNVLDGADVGSETPMEVVLPDVSSTLINVVNPNEDIAIAELSLQNTAGTTLETVNRVIPARGRLFQQVSALFNAPVGEENYVRVRGTDRSLISFALLGGQLNFIAGLNGQPTDKGGTLLYNPQYVNGGGFSSEMNIVNLENRAGQVTLRYIRDDGAQIGNTVVRPIPAQGLLKIVGPTPFGLPDGEMLVEGYVVITSDGPRLSGSVKFGDPGKKRFQTALPFVGTLRNSVLFSQVAQGVFNFFTGVAVLNPHARSITVLIEVFDSAGKLVASGQRTILPSGRVTVVLSQIESTLSLNEGYFKVTAADTFASFAVFGTGDLGVLSAIPPQIP